MVNKDFVNLPLILVITLLSTQETLSITRSVFILGDCHGTNVPMGEEKYTLAQLGQVQCICRAVGQAVGWP